MKISEEYDDSDIFFQGNFESEIEIKSGETIEFEFNMIVTLPGLYKSKALGIQLLRSQEASKAPLVPRISEQF